MGLMAQFVDRLGVMYGGKLIEEGDTRETFRTPRHPYTQILIDSLPSFDEEPRLVKTSGAAAFAARAAARLRLPPALPEAIRPVRQRRAAYSRRSTASSASPACSTNRRGPDQASPVAARQAVESVS